MTSFEYFLKLTKIPRPSKKEEKIRDFLVDFAIKNNLKYYTDENKNVIMIKINNSDKSIILQAHTDMVCEKTKDKIIDFDTQGIDVVIDGDYITADRTTLGADDGYGVSLILYCLEHCGEGFPNIEAIFTTDEEAGMSGVKNLDCSMLKSKMIIGLDGASSNEITVSCAGSQRFQFMRKVHFSKNKTPAYKLEINNLLGGHSGEEINQNRANANKLAFDFLALCYNVKLVSFSGGNKDNAIPRDAEVVFTSEDNKIYSKFETYKKQSASIYPNETAISMTLEDDFSETAISLAVSKEIINFAFEFKNGVLVYDENIENFPITSINLSRVQIDENGVLIRSMLRSSVKELEDEYVAKYEELAELYNIDVIRDDKSPYFERSKTHNLENICATAYKNLWYDDLVINGIHAGLEGGVFAEKIPNAEIVVLGCDVKNLHSPDETMKISSMTKLEKWLTEIMKLYVKQN